MDKYPVLIVDDDDSVRFVLERTLRHDGYSIDTAAGGGEAIEKLSRGRYALVLLDLNMCPIDGLQVLSTLRQQAGHTVVIILTAHGSLESAVEGIRLGAFDYLFKPAATESIRERVRAGIAHYEQSRRREALLDQLEHIRQLLTETESSFAPLPDSATRFLHSGKLVLDRHHRNATLDGKLLDLTTAEFDLLTGLVLAAPAPIGPRQLVNDALNYDCEENEAREIVKWHIHHLRQKIEPDPPHPIYIKTVRYKGYLWSGN